MSRFFGGFENISDFASGWHLIKRVKQILNVIHFENVRTYEKVIRVLCCRIFNRLETNNPVFQCALFTSKWTFYP